MCLKRSPQIQVRIKSFQDHARYRGSRDIMAPRECAKKLLCNINILITETTWLIFINNHISLVLICLYFLLYVQMF